MLGKTFSIMCILSFGCALYTGNMRALSDSIIDGAAKAVSLTLSLFGVMCLWCGIMRLFSYVGLIGRVGCVLRPFLRFAFPTAARDGRGIEEITANISANLLGIGNAATPFALSALSKLQEANENKEIACDDMITLSVLNSSSLTLIPTTMLTMRRLYGSQNAFSVIVPVWIVSFSCSLLSIVICRFFAYLRRRCRRKP